MLSGRSARGAPERGGSFWKVVPRRCRWKGRGDAGLLGTKGDVELAPKLLVAENDGGERLDGGLRPYLLSSHREDKI